MCGIGAIFRYGDGPLEDDPRGWLEAVNARQKARGPDGEGLWVSHDQRVGLGHRRLAIIDFPLQGASPWPPKTVL